MIKVVYISLCCLCMTFTAGGQADIPKEKLQEITNETSGWYQSLSRPQQEVVKSIAQKLIDKIDGNLRDAVIHYSLKKEPSSHWSMVAGGQFQFNKRWQARTEFGFLGGRKSVLLSANYRWRW